MKTVYEHLNEIPDELHQYFKQIQGKWYVIILSMYYISEGFDTLHKAIHHFIDINDEFEHSSEVQHIKERIAKR